MNQIFIFTGITTLFLFIITFLVAVLIRNNSIIDILWGIGFVVIASIIYSLAPTLSTRIILIMVGFWGIRLASHIFARNLGKSEDFRYANWRKQWGSSWVIRAFIQVYLLQWVLMQLVSLPIVLNLGSLTPKTWKILLGVSIWLIGFYFEALGDYQLTVFKSKPTSRGKLMTTGLWRYTRHPNYFGEATLWWGVALIAYFSSGNLLAFVGPLTINFLLLFVSGIPMLEAKYKGRRDWAAYARRTSAFFPLPPRK